MTIQASTGRAKPLDTYYGGYWFRSRLEARWYVAFEALGVKAEYEEQGYDLDGEPYLPDFYLPERGMWAEVKPDLEMSNLSKPIALARLTGQPVAVLGGIPDEGSTGPHHILVGYDRFGNFTAGWFTWLPTSAEVGGVLEEPHGFVRFIGSENRLEDMWRIRRSEVVIPDLIADAYRAARTVRFEHGETGKSWSIPTMRERET